MDKISPPLAKHERTLPDGVLDAGMYLGICIAVPELQLRDNTDPEPLQIVHVQYSCQTQMTVIIALVGNDARAKKTIILPNDCIQKHLVRPPVFVSL